MGKESQVEINGHLYRYHYDEDTQKTVYDGPVGDAPTISEAEFMAAAAVEHRIDLRRVSNPSRMIQDAWPHNLYYDGINLHQFYRDHMELMADKLGIGKEESMLIEDEEGGDYWEEWVVRGQESYLGYIPSEDTFLSGWDMFPPDVGAGKVMFKIRAGEIEILSTEIEYDSGMVYGNKAGLYNWHKEYSDLIDVRLD